MLSKWLGHLPAVGADNPGSIPGGVTDIGNFNILAAYQYFGWHLNANARNLGNFKT